MNRIAWMWKKKDSRFARTWQRRLVRITHRYLKKGNKDNAFVEDPTEGYHHPEAW